MSYEHEDVTMSRMDGVKKTAAYLKPLLIEAPYEGRQDKLFNKRVKLPFHYFKRTPPTFR
ncbi:MAG: hypothetical protein V8R80_04975 [Eubacterium sp.]